MLNLVSKYRHYIAALLLFYFNLDVIIWSGDIGLQSVMYLVQGICFVLFLKLHDKSQCNANAFFLLIVVSLLVSIVHLFSSVTYYYKLFLFPLIYLMLKKTTIWELQVSYYKITWFFAIVSLVFYISCNYLGLGNLMPIAFQGGAGASYSTNFLYSHITNWTVRNGGIFREPGVYQIYLNIALLFYYQINKDKLIDKFTGPILIAVFTTLSSAGIMIAISILIYQTLQQKNRNIGTTITFIAFVLIAYIAIMASFDSIFYKLQMGKDESMSAFARYYSVSIPLKMWIDYPLFGCGNEEFNELILHYPADNGLRLNPYLVTNSLTVIFATSGVFLGCLCLFGICKGATLLCCNYKFPIITVH